MIEKQNKNWIKWIDAVRALAIISVVYCHCLQTVYTINAENTANLPVLHEIFVLISAYAGRLGVPLFLMISGYLLLGRKYTAEKCIGFWKNKWLHLLICTELWLIIYFVFFNIMGNDTGSLGRLIGEMFFMRNSSANQMWYMPMILGMYVLIPFAANALNSVDTKLLRFPLIMYFIYCFGYPLIYNFLSVLNKEDGMSQMFSSGFSGGAYGFYLILGFLIRNKVMRKCRKSILIFVMVLSLVCTVGFQKWSFYEGYTYSLWYSFPFLCTGAFSLFELLSRIKEFPLYKQIHFISYYSFAVYLIHNIFRKILGNMIMAMPIYSPFKVFVLTVLVFGSSVAAVCLIKRIPLVGKYVLYLK